MTEGRFWETKTLEEMTKEEWESLCDGCGRCCLLKLEDEDTLELYYTSVVCQYHDNDNCCCTKYKERSTLVPECIQVTPQVAREEKWLPASCAYRLLAEGKPLFDWHPLISGDPMSVHTAGVSVKNKTIDEQYVHPDELEEHIITSIDQY
jgi:uncharacterized cysteine cluster protein YcgN (CxxCxxCC family)